MKALRVFRVTLTNDGLMLWGVLMYMSITKSHRSKIEANSLVIVPFSSSAFWLVNDAFEKSKISSLQGEWERDYLSCFRMFMQLSQRF